MLTSLREHYPTELTRDQLARATGIKEDASTFRSAIGRLRTLDLVMPSPRICLTDAFAEAVGAS
jgi:hypothetical protein